MFILFIFSILALSVSGSKKRQPFFFLMITPFDSIFDEIFPSDESFSKGPHILDRIRFIEVQIDSIITLKTKKIKTVFVF